MIFDKNIINSELQDLWKIQNGFSSKQISYKLHNTEYVKVCSSTECTVNPQGFRSSYDFKNLGKHSNKFKIGFFGCSLVEGIGLSEEHMWVNMLLNKIGDRNVIGLNFGKGGCSNEYIFWNLIKAHYTIGLDMVIILYTSPNRRLFVNPNHKQNTAFMHWINSPHWGPYQNKLISDQEFEIIKNFEFSQEADNLNILQCVTSCRTFIKENNLLSIERAWSKNIEGSFGSYSLKSIDHCYNNMNKESRISHRHAADWTGKNGHPGITFNETLSEYIFKDYEEIKKSI